MDVKSQKVKNLVHRPSNFESGTENQKPGVKWVSDRLLDYLKEWVTGTHDYQICLEMEDGKVLATGITTSLIERYIKNDPGLSLREKERIKEFIQNAIGFNLAGLGEKDLKSVGGLLAVTKNLDVVKELLKLKLKNFNPIVRFFEENSDILNKATSKSGKQTVIDSVQSLDDYPELINDPILKRIFNSRNSAMVIRKIGSNPGLLNMDPELLNRVLNSEYPGSVLEQFIKFPVLLTVNTEFLKSTFESEHLRDIAEYPILATMDKELFKKISENRNKKILFSAFAKNPELMELKADFWDRIFRNTLAVDNLLDLIKDFPKIIYQKPELVEKIIFNPRGNVILNAISPNYEILELITPELMNKILSSFDAEQILRSIANNTELLELEPQYADKLLFGPNSEIILQQPEYFQGLDLESLKKILDSSDPFKALEISHLRKYITFSHDDDSNEAINENETQFHLNEATIHLNEDSFCDDDLLWNILIQREGNITNADWELIKANLKDIFDGVFKEMAVKKGLLSKFFAQCMYTSEAQESLAGKQNIMKRVDAIARILGIYFLELKNDQTPDARKIELEKIIQMALNKMVVGGTACPDRAIVHLRETETLLKLFAHPEYTANIFLNMFKLDAIRKQLIDEDQSENIETFLRYTFLLNNLLSLGVSGTMLHEAVGKTLPLKQALPILSTAFTAKALIEFTAEQEEFRLLYKAEKKAVLESKDAEYQKAYYVYEDAMYGTENNPMPGTYEQQQAASDKMDKIKAEKAQIENSFFSAKARQLYLDKGFLVEEK